MRIHYIYTPTHTHELRIHTQMYITNDGQYFTGELYTLEACVQGVHFSNPQTGLLTELIELVKNVRNKGFPVI